jgi:hypothetical protein
MSHNKQKLADWFECIVQMCVIVFCETHFISYTTWMNFIHVPSQSLAPVFHYTKNTNILYEHPNTKKPL